MANCTTSPFTLDHPLFFPLRRAVCAWRRSQNYRTLRLHFYWCDMYAFFTKYAWSSSGEDVSATSNCLSSAVAVPCSPLRSGALHSHGKPSDYSRRRPNHSIHRNGCTISLRGTGRCILPSASSHSASRCPSRVTERQMSRFFCPML